MILKNSTVIGIPTKLNLKFFRYWVEILRPLHHINPKDGEILATFLYERYLLSKKINDVELLDTILMSKEIKEKVREKCNIPPDYFPVILNHLRNKKAIVNNKIDTRFIPKFDTDESDFKLIFHFQFDEE